MPDRRVKGKDQGDNEGYEEFRQMPSVPAGSVILDRRPGGNFPSIKPESTGQASTMLAPIEHAPPVYTAGREYWHASTGINDVQAHMAPSASTGISPHEAGFVRYAPASDRRDPFFQHQPWTLRPPPFPGAFRQVPQVVEPSLYPTYRSVVELAGGRSIVPPPESIYRDHIREDEPRHFSMEDSHFVEADTSRLMARYPDEQETSVSFESHSYAQAVVPAFPPLKKMTTQKDRIGRKAKPICKAAGCERESTRRNRCTEHSNERKCSFPGCTTTAQSKGKCKKHGGGTRCGYKNCTKATQSNGRCRAHGGGKRCLVYGCSRWSQRFGVCHAHRHHGTDTPALDASVSPDVQS